jgi:hypothetical protein
MRLTKRDGLATVCVGAAVLLYLLSPSDIWLFGLTGSQALAVAIFALGVGACYTTLSQMKDVYGYEGRERPPMLYVVLSTLLGAVMLAAGVIAIAGGSSAALATLTGAMVVLWVMTTVRHSASVRVPGIAHPAH